MKTESAKTPDIRVNANDLLAAVAYLLRETFEGPPKGQPSAYLDQGAGFFQTLSDLPSSAASKEFYGTTIAAQTEHAKFYLDRLCEFLHGRTEKVNWEDSWLIDSVSDEEWDALRETVKRSYEKALVSLKQVENWNEESVGMAIGMVVHTGYHLGAVRQIVKNARSAK